MDAHPDRSPADSPDCGPEPEQPAHGSHSTPPPSDDERDERRSLLDFEPVPVRARVDGWTPERQRAFIDVLADCGNVLLAAARVGMSEQSAHNLRKRPGAESFNRAWENAVRLAKSRLASIAWQRGVEGVEVPYYYRGELVGTRRHYSDRLLMFLIANVRDSDPARAADGLREEVREESPRWRDEIGRHKEMDAIRDLFVHEARDGVLYVGFPPPPGFEGEEFGTFGQPGYRRTLSAAEQAVIDGDRSEAEREEYEAARAARDFFFGFDGG
jgi:hypothetical protein